MGNKCINKIEGSDFDSAVGHMISQWMSTNKIAYCEKFSHGPDRHNVFITRVYKHKYGHPIRPPLTFKICRQNHPKKVVVRAFLFKEGELSHTTSHQTSSLLASSDEDGPLRVTYYYDIRSSSRSSVESSEATEVSSEVSTESSEATVEPVDSSETSENASTVSAKTV